MSNLNFYVNGESYSFNEQSLSLSNLCTELDLDLNGLAISVNNKIIPKQAWDKTMLNNNDQILLVTAAQGG